MMSLDMERVMAQADAIIASSYYPAAASIPLPSLVPTSFSGGMAPPYAEGPSYPPPPPPPPPSQHHSQQYRQTVPLYFSPPPLPSPLRAAPSLTRSTPSFVAQYTTPTSEAMDWALNVFSQQRRGESSRHSHVASSHSRRFPRKASPLRVSESQLRATHRSPHTRSSSSTPRPPHWSLSDFELGKKLGEGRFGKIYLARERSSKCAVAIKCISKDIVAKSSLEEQIQREVDVHGLIHTREMRDLTATTLGEAPDGEEGGGEHVLRLLAYFWDANVVYLVEEHADRGDLSRHLASQPDGRLCELHAQEVVRGLCAGVQYLHDRHILHRDIKSENILLKTKRLIRRGGEVPAGCFEYDVKLSDFTWAVQLPAVLRRGDRRTTLCGTLDYLAPEVVKQEPYDYGVDMWGIGVVTYELLFGIPPFEHADPTETCRRIARCEFQFPPNVQVAEGAKDFIKSLLIPDARGRMSAGQALYHPWLTPSPLPCEDVDPSVANSPSRMLHHTVGDFTPLHSSQPLSNSQQPDVSETTLSERVPSGDSGTTTGMRDGGQSINTTYRGGTSHWSSHPNSTSEGSAVHVEGSAANFSGTMRPGVPKPIGSTVVLPDAWTPNLSAIPEEGGGPVTAGGGGSTPPSTNTSYEYVHRVLDMEDGSTPAHSPVRSEATPQLGGGETLQLPALSAYHQDSSSSRSQSLPSSLAGSIQNSLYSAATPNSYSSD